VGEAVRRLGAGRLHPSQSVDPAVGLELIAQVGDPVARDEPVAIVHARDGYLGEACAETIRGLLAIGSAPPVERPLILHHDREDADGAAAGTQAAPGA
jgi:thymidine phosphorylase